MSSRDTLSPNNYESLKKNYMKAMKFLAINETVNIIVNENEEEINGLKVQLETVKKDLAELKGLQEVIERARS